MSNITNKFELKNPELAKRKINEILFWLEMKSEEKSCRDNWSRIVQDAILEFKSDSETASPHEWSHIEERLVDSAMSGSLVVISMLGMEVVDRQSDITETDYYDCEIKLGLNGLESDDSNTVVVKFIRENSVSDGSSFERVSIELADTKIDLDDLIEEMPSLEGFLEEYLLDAFRYAFLDFSPANPSVSNEFLEALNKECN